MSILYIRWVCRMMYNLDHWTAESSAAEIYWFIPVINLFIAFIGSFVVLNSLLKAQKAKNLFWKNFLNQDLK